MVDDSMAFVDFSFRRRARTRANPSPSVVCLASFLAYGCSDDNTSFPAGDAGEKTVASTNVDSTDGGQAMTESDASNANDGSNSSDVFSTESPATNSEAATSATSEPFATGQEGSSTSGPSGSTVTDGGMGAQTTDDSSSGQLGMCDRLPTGPVSLEVTDLQLSYTTEFAFDHAGNVVYEGSGGHLKRVTRAGDEQIWTDVTSVRNIVVLADGSAVGSQGDSGRSSWRLQRIYPNGTERLLVRGLEQPEGMVLGPDGFLYVAEGDGSRVLRVDVDSGAFTIAALGLHAPHRIVFGADPSVMYVSSREGSVIYKVVFATPTSLGQASIFARSFDSDVTEPTAQCHQQVGVYCELPNRQAARCKAVGDVVDCFRENPCFLMQDGTACVFPQDGVCKSQVCVDTCNGSVLGATCELDEYSEGICVADAAGTNLYCAAPRACADKEVGDACDNGICDDLYSTEFLACRALTECDDLGIGQACTDNSTGKGICVEQEHSSPYCDDNPCLVLEEGDACDSPYSTLPGACAVSWQGLECRTISPCEGRELGASCWTGETAGACELNDRRFVECRSNPCLDAELWDNCFVGGVEVSRCAEGEGGLYCQTAADTCYGKSGGDACRHVAPGYRTRDGLCEEDGEVIRCVAVDLCAGRQAGDGCATSRGPGRCVENAGELECRRLCEGLHLGDECPHAGGHATCQAPVNFEEFTCTLSEPCALLDDGDACQSDWGPGTCVSSVYSQTKDCLPLSCAALGDGTACTQANGGVGKCSSGECTATLGAISGLEADACGNVYASDAATGNLWRISPAGEWELIAVVPERALYDLHWGNGLGGFDSDVLYAAHNGEHKIYAIQVGVASARSVNAEQP